MSDSEDNLPIYHKQPIKFKKTIGEMAKQTEERIIKAKQKEQEEKKKELQAQQEAKAKFDDDKYKMEIYDHLLSAHTLIKRKLTDSQAQDRKYEYKWLETEYVDKIWIIKHLVKLRMRCPKCSGLMKYKWPPRDKLQWCLDRLNPNKPYTKDNCQIICYRCKIFPETTIDLQDL